MSGLDVTKMEEGTCPRKTIKDEFVIQISRSCQAERKHSLFHASRETGPFFSHTKGDNGKAGPVGINHGGEQGRKKRKEKYYVQGTTGRVTGGSPI
jgi:hypothetical protein